MESQSTDYMYSPFRPKSVNPKDWDFKMNYWVKKINDILTSKNKIAITFDELCELIKHKNKIPLGINEIFAEIIKKGMIVDYEQFFKESSLSWIDWGKDSLYKYSKTMISYLPLSDYLIKNNLTKYIYQQNLDKIGTCIFKIHTTHQDSYKSIKQIHENCVSLKISNEDIKLSLIHLQNKGLIFYDSLNDLDDPNTLIKFISTDKQNIYDDHFHANILKLKKIEKLIEDDIEKLTFDIDKCIMDAKLHIKSQNRSKARLFVKQKMIYEDRLRKKEAIWENIKNMIGQIYESHSNKMIIDAYKASAEAYKKSMASINQDRQKLDETMDEIQELVDTQQDLQDTLANTSLFDRNADINENEDIEKELEELLREERETRNLPFREGETKVKVKSSPTSPSINMGRNLYPTLRLSEDSISERTPNKATSSAYADIQKTLEEMDLDDILPSVPDILPNAKDKYGSKEAAR